MEMLKMLLSEQSFLMRC